MNPYLSPRNQTEWQKKIGGLRLGRRNLQGSLVLYVRSQSVNDSKPRPLFHLPALFETATKVDDS